MVSVQITARENHRGTWAAGPGELGSERDHDRGVVKTKTTMPVNATCHDRFEAIDNKRRWTAYPAKADKAVRFPDDAWRALFKCPTIPHEAKEKLKAEQGASSSHVFRAPARRKLEELLVDVDMAAWSGMKFAFVLMQSSIDEAPPTAPRGRKPGVQK